MDPLSAQPELQFPHSTLQRRKYSREPVTSGLGTGQQHQIASARGRPRTILSWSTNPTHMALTSGFSLKLE